MQVEKIMNEAVVKWKTGEYVNATYDTVNIRVSQTYHIHVHVHVISSFVIRSHEMTFHGLVNCGFNFVSASYIALKKWNTEAGLHKNRLLLMYLCCNQKCYNNK